MSWATTDLMTERIKFVLAAEQKRTSFTSLCRAFGITPKTGYKWRHRYKKSGLAGLHDQSRRPRSNSRSPGDDVEARLIALRRRHPTWGARTLVAWLRMHEPHWKLP